MASGPENWEKVKALFKETLELNPTARAAFLRDHCADTQTRAEVERLLAEYDEAAEFLSKPALTALRESEFSTRVPRFSPGELLAERFRILRFIAAGGMGEVYEAEDQELHERIAIKTIRAPVLAQPNALVRFKREVHLARKVTHPNVCRVFDLFLHRPDGPNVQEETVFISMELLNGTTLDAHMKEAGRMSPDEALPLVRSMASALAAAHAAGIVHRDFKPGNVVLVRATGQEKWRPVVTDFGLALQNLITEGSVTASSTQGLLGTPAYMSPEQLEGRAATQASDIYAFGLVVYEMVTGVQPFRGDTPISAALKRLSEPPSPPRKFQPELNSAWNAIILRCLDRDPAKRFVNVEEVAKLLGGEGPPVSGINFKVLAAQSKRPIVAIPVVLILLTVIGLSGWLLNHSSRARWARNQALPQITQLIQHEKLHEAYALAIQAERYIPHDPMLEKVWSDISWSTSIRTTPPSGVSVYRRDYNAPNEKWEFVGRTPIEKKRFPLVQSRWKFELKGFVTVQRATFYPIDSLTVTMDEVGKAHPEMVRVELSQASPQNSPVTLFGLSGFETLPAVPVSNYWIDRYEVTNAEFKRFLDDGGYEKPQYWKFEFRKDGRRLSWSEAMKLFLDTTGRPGPASWIQGEYPRGQGDFPVSGVSWFEAAAYAEFAGKSLPTIYQWVAAASPWNSASIIPASNFGGAGPARVGSYPGMSWSGAYDMAGNVKEWCFNEAYSGNRYIMGGAWDDPTYIFNSADARSPFQRSPNIGFRSAMYVLSGETARAADPVTIQTRDYSKEKPVSDQLFRVYKSLYAYDKTPLHAVLESAQQTDNWKMEKVTFDAAYGNERMIAYLFLPTKVHPPYQAIIHFPNSDANYFPSFTTALPDFLEDFDFIIKSGRAVVLPVYKSTFERGDGIKPVFWPNPTNSYRDHVIAWSKDLGRTIDYLETRDDIDHNKLAYEGHSWGAALGSLLPAVEDRFKSLVLVAGGFSLRKTLPEADQINFAPRVKVPVLMLNGRYDFVYPPGSAQEPMFRLLGTPKENKRRVVYNSSHDIPRSEMIKQTLDWLDRYLGPVE